MKLNQSSYHQTTDTIPLRVILDALHAVTQNPKHGVEKPSICSKSEPASGPWLMNSGMSAVSPTDGTHPHCGHCGDA